MIPMYCPSVFSEVFKSGYWSIWIFHMFFFFNNWESDGNVLLFRACCIFITPSSICILGYVVFAIVCMRRLYGTICFYSANFLSICFCCSGMEPWWNVRYMVKFKWILTSPDFPIWLFLLQILLFWMMWDSILVFGFVHGNLTSFCPSCLLMGSLSSWVTGLWSFESEWPFHWDRRPRNNRSISFHNHSIKPNTT